MDDPSELADALRAALGAALGSDAQSAAFEPVGRPGLVPDATTKLRIRGAGGRPLAFAIVSAARAPDLVARGAERARAAAALLAPDLARAVLVPIAEGRLPDRRSFVLLPHCAPLSEVRLRGSLQQRRLRPRVLRWLAGVTAASARPVAGAEREAHFERPLRALERFPELPERVAAEARHALARLEAGRFAPRAVLAHNDLWPGNVLIAPEPAGVPWLERFVVIDWAGALLDGHPLFDLVRAAHGFGASRAELRREVEAHCAALGAPLEDAPCHLAAALARIAASLEHFPPEAFRRMAATCVATLETALAV